MKKVLALCLSLLFCQYLTAQEKTQTMETLSNRGTGKLRVGGYASPTVKFSTLDDKLAVIVGGSAGVMLNSKVTLGLAGYALVNSIEAPRVNTIDPTEYWTMWYAGFLPEYTFNSNKLFHVSVGALIGGGGIMRGERLRDTEKQVWHDQSGFFVTEPQVNAEMNITTFLRIGIGVSYRLVAGSNTPNITDSKLSGPAAQFVIKAGRF
ncbi:hypothetical protein LX64_04057 [Chitinophaga skermanii]|uniref:Outer membrane protein with beta-barrel domain n=1 Tax=Chitinophaga skermanii TaxID=331697 RepID=A0A327Q8Y9_9BACT|nr:hypothetical protein [Chitinophaga skermanii]RAJ00354.1 hypothetical protein LX64_04057 [Chitinophaga skermanii]